LIQKAFELGADEVDVNEQNTRALEFYLKHNFQQMARSELDAEGNPFQFTFETEKVIKTIKPLYRIR
jgi:ribosomal protein S18 acetylase RimI-like enzyme